jgi:hypothetical protein
MGVRRSRLHRLGRYACACLGGLEKKALRMKLQNGPAHWHMKDRQRLKLAQRDARRELPAEWLPIINAEARQARPEWGGFRGHPLAQAEVYGDWLAEFGGPAPSDLTDAQIKARAQAMALEARALDIGELAGPWGEFVRLLDFCRSREVDPPPLALNLRGMAARVRCPYWWRRALRRMVARKCERGAMALGLVSKPAGQAYASNSAVRRRLDQNKRNADAAQAIYFENDEGRVSTLAELAATSTSNKAIRRGELMTRIRGCEEIAEECGHVGLFLTLTLPSRFHATLMDGRRNPKHDGSTPRDGQQWLCLLWGRARAKLARMGVGVYGFRVAEPHHDGCVHWHALLWAESEADAETVERVIWHLWLSDDGRWATPSVPEKGALKYRVNCKRMERGGAAGYIAKYIAKNIDDHGIESHLDDYAEGPIGPDLLGDLEIKPSMRVEAWAATWGVRQFQPIGQPPVGVWRELRRIKESEARKAGFNGMVHRAWLAAQRVGGVLADWGRYVKAQGGLMRGRRCNILVRSHMVEGDGLYGRALRRLPLGVALNVRGSHTVWSNRRLWKPVEMSAAVASRAQRAATALAARSGAPRTGVNNCTVASEVDAINEDFLRGKGGANPEIPACPDALNWPPCSAAPPSPAPMRH